MQPLEQEVATVVAIDGDSVCLQTETKNGCGECSSKSSCGSMKLFTPKQDESYLLKVENKLGLKVGDAVTLELSGAKLIQGSLLLYLLPLFALFVFAGLGKMLAGEMASAMAGLSGLTLALFWVKKHLAKKAVSTHFLPKITQIVSKTP